MSHHSPLYSRSIHWASKNALPSHDLLAENVLPASFQSMSLSGMKMLAGVLVWEGQFQISKFYLRNLPEND
ncbi:MAG: hypothetical protein ACPGRV_02380, partial [Candidatus Thalassarchaeaceae archaeon]